MSSPFFAPSIPSVVYKTDVPLSRMCSMHLGGIAPLVAYPSDVPSCIQLLRVWRAMGISYRIVGAMTNTLPPDGNLAYPLLCTTHMRGIREDGDAVTVEAGVHLGVLAHRFMARGLDVCAQLATIPGTVGGAVRGNAGAFGCAMEAYVIACEVYDPSTDAVCRYAAEEMAFGYRDSRLKHAPQIVLSATLRVCVQNVDDMRRREAEVLCLRRKTQPTDPSLGSIFLRLPDGRATAALIDAAGLKGMCVGGAMVSPRHAGFIVNTGDARAADVMALIRLIRRRLYELYGVRPACEICLLPSDI